MAKFRTIWQNLVTLAAATITVAVDELVIGSPLQTHLASGQERLYRITVPRDRIALAGNSTEKRKSAGPVPGSGGTSPPRPRKPS